MSLTHPYRKSNDELSLMDDFELRSYIDSLYLDYARAKGYGRKQFRLEITRAEKLLRTTVEDY